MNTYEYFKDITSEELIDDIVDDAFNRVHIMREACASAGLDYDSLFATKNQSETLSRVFERVSAEHYSEHLGTEVTTPTSVTEPDLCFVEKELSLEIKVTAGDVWTGGSFSKRPGAYLLISWDKESKNKCFVALTDLQKDDWIPGTDTFYGTKFPKKRLFEACQRGEATVLKGSLTAHPSRPGCHVLTKDIVKEA